MNIKIECGCGTKYSFDVEPRDGQMPWTVQCPACHADGTGAANRIIAEKSSAGETPVAAFARRNGLVWRRASRRRAATTARRAKTRPCRV